MIPIIICVCSKHTLYVSVNLSIETVILLLGIDCGLVFKTENMYAVCIHRYTVDDYVYS